MKEKQLIKERRYVYKLQKIKEEGEKMVISKIDNKEVIEKVAYSAIEQLLSMTKCATYKDIKKLSELILEISEELVMAKA